MVVGSLAQSEERNVRNVKAPRSKLGISIYIYIYYYIILKYIKCANRESNPDHIVGNDVF